MPEPENVIKMETARLDRLADQIRDDISRRDEGWVAATLDLITHLTEARTQLRADKAFGAWCDAQDFALNKEDRAAAVRMGQDMALAREVLITTERRSLQHIELNEFRPRIIHVNNPSKPRRGRPPGKRPPSPQIDKAEAYLRDLAAKGQSRPSDYKKAAKAVGVSYGTMERALDRERVERETRAEMEAKAEAAEREAVLDREAAATIEALPEPRRMKAKEALDHLKAKLERENEKLKAKLEADINRRAIAESRAWIDKNFLPTWQERVNHADKVLEAAKGVMSSDIFTKFLKVAHPDNSSATETRAEVFRWLNENRKVLIKPEPAAFWPPMPKDREEMEQWKQHGVPKQPRNEAERKAYDVFVENLRREREKKAEREAKRAAKAKGESTDAAQ